MRYAHIISRLVNQPFYMDAAKLDTISNMVTMRLLQGQPLEVGMYSGQVERKYNKEGQEVGKKFHKIEVFGSLASHNAVGESGTTSYQDLNNQVMLQLQEGNTNIEFVIDSGGGEVAGLFNFTNFVNSIPKLYAGVTTTAYIIGNACSAAYAIASACQKVIAVEGTTTGSIGAVIARVDMTAKDAKDGISYEIYRSKELKALGSAHEPTTDLLKAKIDRILAEADTQFNNAVVTYRPQVTMEIIINLKGDTVSAEEALKLGLIDAIVPSINMIGTSVNTSPMNDSLTLQTKKGGSMSTALEDAMLQLQAKDTEIAKLRAELASVSVTAKAEAEQRIYGILESAKTLGILQAKNGVDTAVAMAKTGATPEMATIMFTMQKSNEEEKKGIVSSLPDTMSTQASDILEMSGLQAQAAYLTGRFKKGGR